MRESLVLTKHAEKRLRKRCACKKGNAEEKFADAIKYGLSWNELRGQAKRYFDKLANKYPTKTSYLIYENNVYIYTMHGEDPVMITVYSAPSNIVKIYQSIKNKIQR